MDPAVSTSPQKLTTFTPQSDSAKYIRTYAKDVAKLKNQQPPATQPKSVPEPASTPTQYGVVLPAFDPSPVNNPDKPSSSRQFPQETLELQGSDSDGIFSTTPKPLETPPVPPPQPKAQEQQPSAEEVRTREEILNRLRTKISAAPPAPISETKPAPKQDPELASPPAFTIEKGEPPIRTAAPDFTGFSVAAIQPEQTETAPSPLHTYSSDFAERIDSKQSSTFAALAAESDAKGAVPAVVAKPRRHYAPLIAGIVMVIVGIGAVFGAYQFMATMTELPYTATVPSALTYEEAVEVRGSGTELIRAVAAVAQGGSVSGNVIVTYVTGASESDGSNIPQPGAALIKRLGLQAPSILLRNLQDISTVGVVNAGNEAHPFMVLKVNSYERTFAGMLTWERTIQQELDVWYPLYSSIPTTESVDTSATPVISLQPEPGFTDATVANYDVRILRDASGRSIVLYGYKGKDTLIIARDKAAFTTLINRIRSEGQ